MNDEIEHRPVKLCRATQPGCRHWAPIVPPIPDDKERSGERQAMPYPVADTLSLADKKPD